MTRTVETSPVTAGYLAALEARMSRPIGDARKPAGVEGLYPYAVLYTGLTRDGGDLVNAHEDGLHRLQVSCVGLSRESAEWLRDRCREVLHDKSVVIDGYRVVWTESAGSPPTFRDDDLTPSVFTAVEVVNAFVAPASGS